MIIREALRIDAMEIVNFQIAMALETENFKLDRTSIEKGVFAVFDDQSKGQYFIVEIDGKVVGSMMTTYEWSDWRNGTIIWFQSVYITPENRGKGLFKRMYEHLKEKVLNNSELVGLRLYVDNTNTNAQHVYKAVGMNGDHYKTFEWIKN